MLGLLGLASFTFGALKAISSQVGSLDPNRQQLHQQANTYVYAGDGHTILEILRGSQARVIVPSGQISPWLKHAIVAIEDKRFYEHGGIDVRGILRAAYNDIRGRPVQGGSTITQQFVKNSLNANAPTIARKLREAALAWQVEKQWSKDRILTAYLNTIYFGNGAYGVQQACRIYFARSAKDVDLAQAALLAGIPEDPSLYDPVAHPLFARARRNLVLLQMYKQNYINEPQYARAVREPMPKPQDVQLPSTQSPVGAPYFANYVTDQLLHLYKPQVVFGGGLHVTTTIDLGLEKLARAAIAKELPPSVGPTAALVALDARTGAVLAMVGGRNYHQSQFNLATQGERQPGSAFKPFVLAAALKAGMAPSTTFVSGPVTIDAGGRLWNVNNYEGENLGPIDLTKATAVSDNTVFAQLTNVVGPPNVVKAAHDLGITSPLQPYFSIGLGGEPATPIEMARAFASFANGGYRVDGSIFGNNPRAIECVAKPGKACKENAPVLVPALSSSDPTLNAERAAIIDSLLEGVVQYGTGVAAAIPGREIAGKTGTTENYGDAWFVGFTPQIVTAVWVGYPNKLVPMLSQFHGHAVVGGTYPALIWKDFMTQALAYFHLPAETFAAPPSLFGSPLRVTFRNNQLERDNGNCKNAATVDFFDGGAPTKVANCKHDEVDVPDVLGSTLAKAKARLYGQPLQWTIVYKPAKPGQRVSIVTGQIPRRGTLSAYQTVTLVVPKAQHGIVPRLVGLTIARARAKAAPLKLALRLTGSRTGTVLSQEPHWGVAAAPGMDVVLRLKRAVSKPGKAG